MRRRGIINSVHLILLLQPCHALAAAASSTSKIISRKSDGQYKTYHLDGVSNDGRSKNTLQIYPSVVLHRVQAALRSTFLPALPGNAGKEWLSELRNSEYLKYIIYDNIQDLSTSLRSVLATQRILEGVGVGRAGATALSATLNFIIRDGCGMLASLLFTSYVAHSFRRNVKRWKFFADIMVDVGLTMEIVAPSLPIQWFLPLLCLGNVCKALCGVAAGACSGALQVYWANNLLGTEEGLSEIAAKNGAQRTVIGGLGLILAGIGAKLLGSANIRIAIGLYCILTGIHLVTNYRALKLISLDWFNGWRLHQVVEEFLSCVGGNEGSIVVSNPIDASEKEPLLFLPEWRQSSNTIRMGNPIDASKKEPFLFLPEWRSITTDDIRMGVSFNEFSRLSCQTSSVIQSRILTKQSSRRKDNYIITVGHATKRHFNSKRCILVSYFSNSSNAEKAKAYLHGCLIRRALAATTCNSKHGDNEMELIQKERNAEELAENELTQLWPVFKKCVTAAGWKLDKTECSTEGYVLFHE